MMRLVAALSLLTLAACTSSEPEPVSWTAVAEADLGAAQREQLATALAAKDELMQALLGELTTALVEGEPADAIYVCKDSAPHLAAEVGAARGLRIGRTSFALRNPDNAPPAWARELVDERADTPRTLASDQGELAVLLPIRLGPQCVACHGTADALDEGARAAIAQAYPDDRATGFSAGDLRGWFWVEVP